MLSYTIVLFYNPIGQ